MALSARLIPASLQGCRQYDITRLKRFEPSISNMFGNSWILMEQISVRNTSLKNCRLHTRIEAMRRGSFLQEMEKIKEEANVAERLSFETPLSIVLYPDPRLRAKNKRINIFDEKLDELVDCMFDVMYKTDGVGLSAPQVGVNVQLMVYNPMGERGKGQEYVLVNPKITKYTKVQESEVEGCLSFPNINAEIERPVGVRVDAQDQKGRKFSLKLNGWQARIFQHEYDHLERVLYFERMTAEVLESIREPLQALEEGYTERTGLQPPERVALRLQKFADK